MGIKIQIMGKWRASPHPLGVDDENSRARRPYQQVQLGYEAEEEEGGKFDPMSLHLLFPHLFFFLKEKKSSNEGPTTSCIEL